MNKKPVYLNLFQFKFPATAIASILHRLSGVALFLALPLVIWALAYSLESEESFFSLKNCLMHPFFKWIWAALLVGLFFHLIAGIRHMIMDMGYGDGKCTGRLGAYLVMSLTGVFALWLGVALW